MNEADKLAILSHSQRNIVELMQSLHTIAQEAGIAFAVDDDGNLVAYNASEVEDCFGEEACNEEDFIELNVNYMRRVFPVWNDSALYVKLKEQS